MQSNESSEVDYVKAGSFYLIGNLFNKGMSFITVPIFTRILTTADYGVVNTYTSFVSIFSMIFGFALYMGIRQAFVELNDEIEQFTSSILSFTIVSGILMIAVLMLVTSISHFGVSAGLILLCLLHSLASSLIQDYLQYLMMKYQYKLRACFMILPNLISVIMSVITILFITKTQRYWGRIIPTACVTIAFGLIVLGMVYAKTKPCMKRSHLKYGLTLSLPLVLHGIALNILSQSDRSMITWLADSSQTGIYSLVYNFSTLATVITTALDGIWIPWFLQRLNERKITDINSAAVGYIRLMTIAMVGLVLCGPEIIKLLASEPYWEGIKIIPPIVLSNYVIFIYTLYVNIEHYYKKTATITTYTVIAAVVNVVLNYFLIPKYGYIAAAYTTLIAYIIALGLHVQCAKRIEPTVYPMRLFTPMLLEISVMIVVFYVFIDMGWIRWILTFVYILVELVLNLNQIKAFQNRSGR